MKNMMDLGAKDCRFPLGEPGTREFGFCGMHAPKQPYCDFHHAIAYQVKGPSKREIEQAREAQRIFNAAFGVV